METVPGFADAEGLWTQRLGNLRNTVRQELIARQLAEHVSRAFSVLDVGCGQGTQAIRLAQAGCRVVGVDRSPELLTMLASSAAAAGTSVEAIQAEFPALEPSLAGRTFDVVCAHGVLMYLDDVRAALTALTARMSTN